MIKLSIKGLAKFMVANSAKQRKILLDYKYPKKEGNAQAAYYRDARDIIHKFHSKQHNLEWLIEQTGLLAHQAMGLHGQMKSRLNNNIRAIKQYAQNYSERKFQTLQEKTLFISFPKLLVSIKPDLHVVERNKEKIIKLHFSKDEPDVRSIKIISQAMFEAQQHAKLGLTSSSVLFFDVPRGIDHKGARAGAKIIREMEAASENIAAIWGSI